MVGIFDYMYTETVPAKLKLQKLEAAIKEDIQWGLYSDYKKSQGPKHKAQS